MNALALDPRQRAMLEEMGVKVWWPAEPVESAERAPAVAREGVTPPAEPTLRREAAPALRTEAPPRLAAARPAPEAKSPVARQADTAKPGASVLIEAPQRLYGGSAAQGGWLIVADMPPEADGRHGEPFAGDAGRLLENMLRALQLHTGALPVHLMRTHRGTAGATSASSPFEHAFEAHAVAIAPRLILAMGPLAAQSLLQRNEPLGKLRGRAEALSLLPGVQAIATYHPAYLLRNSADKARAWADLCLAAERFSAP